MPLYALEGTGAEPWINSNQQTYREPAQRYRAGLAPVAEAAETGLSQPTTHIE